MPNDWAPRPPANQPSNRLLGIAGPPPAAPPTAPAAPPPPTPEQAQKLMIVANILGVVAARSSITPGDVVDAAGDIVAHDLMDPKPVAQVLGTMPLDHSQLPAWLNTIRSNILRSLSPQQPAAPQFQQLQG